MPFTDKQVNALRPRRTRYELPEPERTGLAVRVTPNNVKTWCLRYRHGGAQKRMVLGAYPTLSLADVRVQLAGLTFGDSSAVRALLLGSEAAGEHGASYELVNPSGILRRVLETTGLTEILTIVDEPQPA